MSSSNKIFKRLSISTTPATSANIESANTHTHEEKEDDFTYASINRILQEKISKGDEARHKFNNYTASINLSNPDTKDFIYFVSETPVERDPKKFSYVGTLFKIYGLKFHISLPEDNEEMRHSGWKIIKDILIDNHINTFVNTFKVIQQGKYLSDVEGQQGKDVTIYANFNPEFRTRDWERIFQEITQRLVEAGIKPGYRPPNSTSSPEKPLNGSNYITYKYKDEFKEQNKPENSILLRSLAKITGQDTGATKGWPHFDAIAKISISVNNQPDIPSYISKRVELSEQQDNKLEYSKRPH